MSKVKKKYRPSETQKGNMSMNSFMHVKCNIIIAADKLACTEKCLQIYRCQNRSLL